MANIALVNQLPKMFAQYCVVIFLLFVIHLLLKNTLRCFVMLCRTKDIVLKLLYTHIG